MAWALNPFPAVRAFISLEIQAARTAIKNMIVGAEAGVRSEVARAESSVKAYVEGSVGEAEARMLKAIQASEDRILARLRGEPAPALILPDADGPGVPRGRFVREGDAVTGDPLGGRPHP